MNLMFLILISFVFMTPVPSFGTDMRAEYRSPPHPTKKCGGQKGEYLKGPMDRDVQGGGFVAYTAFVSQTAIVHNFSSVCGNAKVLGNAVIERNSTIRGNAIIKGNAKVGERVIVKGDIIISGNAEVKKRSIIMGSGKIHEKAIVRGLVKLKNNEAIGGDGSKEYYPKPITGFMPWE